MKVINNIKPLLERRRELRNNATKQEVLLWYELKNSKAGYKFRRQHGIGGYIVDFYCPSKKLVIEIDGSAHLQKESLEYDQVRSKFLEGLGIKVIRFNNEEINANLHAVIDKIKTSI